MRYINRYILQVIFWLGIWCLLWISADTDIRFILENALAFVLQLILIFVLIAYAVPKFLFQKKILQFLIITISAILLSAFISSEFGPSPKVGPPPGPEMRPGSAKLPSRFLIHLLIMSISSVAAVLIETIIYARNKEQMAALAKAELIESELKLLKMQINPHFLFNALNNIYTLSVTNSEKTQESINTLSEMLRYVIYDCEQAQVPLKKELNYIRNYIRLFNLKSSTHFDINFHQEVADDNTIVAPMIFIPFVENALKHSGIEKGKGSFVLISLVQKGDSIEFTLENSLPSMPKTKDTAGGIGLPNVRKRLELLYPERHELKITKLETFKVYLKLMLA
ncbi:MAG: histidine kinase [Flavobacterium sp.]|nr:MAG: histidine kinase [Flavobacterium sp.]